MPIITFCLEGYGGPLLALKYHTLRERMAGRTSVVARHKGVIGIVILFIVDVE